MLIKVKEEHIQKGEKCNAEACPVALAIKEALGTNVVHVDPYFDSLFINGSSYKCSMDLTYFVEEFDAGEKVEPFSFELEKINELP